MIGGRTNVSKYYKEDRKYDKQTNVKQKKTPKQTNKQTKKTPKDRRKNKPTRS